MSPDAELVTRAALDAAVNCLVQCLDVISHCVDQLSEEQIWWRPEPSMNSIGNLLMHLEGNLRQWIVAGLPGNQDTRNRPAEFSAIGGVDKSELLNRLRMAASEARKVLAGATAQWMLAQRRIQGFHVTGWEAVFDSLPHLKGHTQEIVCLTRQQLKDAYQFRWTPLSPEQGAAESQ